MTGFDETIHSPNRLRICAALSAARQVEFATLERGLGVSKSLLSKQLKVLIDAGYVAVERKPQPFGGADLRRSQGIPKSRRGPAKNHRGELTSKPAGSACEYQPAGRVDTMATVSGVL